MNMIPNMMDSHNSHHFEVKVWRSLAPWELCKSIFRMDYHLQLCKRDKHESEATADRQ